MKTVKFEYKPTWVTKRFHVPQRSTWRRTLSGFLAAILGVSGVLTAIVVPAPPASASGGSPGTISTIAGGIAPGPTPATNIVINPTREYEAVVNGTNYLYVVDTGEDVIRQINQLTGDEVVVAGSGTSGSTGNGGPATSATLNPSGVTADSSGDIWISGSGYIRFVPASSGTYYGQSMTGGDIYSIAGSGSSCASSTSACGDGGLATAAQFSNVGALSVDSSMNLYIDDASDDRIRFVPASSGIFYGQSMIANDIYTIAGSGSSTSSGDAGVATSAGINLPQGVFVTSTGNMYIAENGGNVIRFVPASSGTFYGQSMIANDIYTIAGNGTTCASSTSACGDGGSATAGNLNGPMSVVADASGNVFVGDYGDHRIRFVPASSGTFYGQSMTANDIYTIAGNGTSGYTGDGGPATSAELSPLYFSLALDQYDNVLVTDGSYDMRLVANVTGTYWGQTMTANDIYTFAGNGKSGTSNDGGYAGDGNLASNATMDYPSGLAVDHTGGVAVSSTNVHVVQYIAGSTGTHFGVSMTQGNIYTVVGTGTGSSTGNGGPATSATIQPSAVALDSNGDLALSDSGSTVRFVPQTSGTYFGVSMTANYIYDVAGNGTSGYLGDGVLATGTEISVDDVALDSAGDLYIADHSANRVRFVPIVSGTYYGVAMTAGYIYTIAGDGTAGFAGDGSTATSAELSSPAGLAIDSAGDLYINDYGNNCIRVVPKTGATIFGQSMTAGDIYTIAGGGTSTTNGSAATSYQLSPDSYQGLSVDSLGDVVIGGYSEAYLVPSSTGTYFGQSMTAGDIYTIAGTGTGGFTGDGGPATNAEINGTNGLAFNATNDLYIADASNNRVRLVVSGDTSPSFTSTASTSFTTGSAGTFDVTASGYPAPSFSETGMLPSGVSLSAGGVLSGTPAPSPHGGSYPLTITASNGVGSNATQAFTLMVDQAPSITSSSTTAFTVGSAGTFDVTASGYPAPSFSETGILPSGVTLSAGGVLSGTPAAGTGGSYPLTITASNGVGSNATQSFALTVDQAPSITSGTTTAFTVGSAGSFTVTTLNSDNPTDALSETGSLPTGVSFTDNGNGTATLTGTPATGSSGSYPLTITASNGVGSNATQSFVLTVNAVPTITTASLPDAQSGAAYSSALVASGGTTPLSWTLLSGALPSGISLSTAGVLSGNTSTTGTSNFTVEVTDANGSTATQALSLVVGTVPSVTSASSATATAGTAFSFSIETSATPAAALSESGTLPSGITFVDNGNGTATISGTAATGSNGSYPLTITASNGVGGNGSQSFVLGVAAAPSVITTSLPAGTQGSVYSESFTASGGAGSLSWSKFSGTLPTGLALSSTGVLSGTPTGSGVSNFTVEVTDANGATGTQAMTLEVDSSPSVAGPSTVAITAGASFSSTFTTTGYPSPSLSETGALPGGVNFTDNGNGTATLDGVPSGNGTFDITVTASNGIGSNAQEPVVVSLALSPSVSTTSLPAATDGSSYSQTLANTGGTAPFTWSLFSGTLPTGLALSSTGVISGTPSGSGASNFTVEVSDTNGATATQAMTMLAGTVPAFASASSASANTTSPFSFTVTTNAAPTAALSVVVGALPSGVSFTDNGDGTGTLSGTPAVGTGGVYNLTLAAANGIGSNVTQAFTLTVAQAPAITSANVSAFDVGESESFAITASGYPAVTFSETGVLPSGVTLSAAGLLSGTPAIGSAGDYPLTLSATNGNSPDATQAFTLTVGQAPVFTNPSKTTFVAGTSGSFTFASDGPPAASFSVTSGVLPAGVSLSTAGVLSGTPASGTGGVYDLTVRATDGVPPDATQQFVMTVDQAPSITSDSSTSVSTGNALSFSVVAVGYPSPSVSEIGALPSGVTFSDSADLLWGTPTTSGTWPVTFTASNGVGSSANQSFTLVVTTPQGGGGTSPTPPAPDPTTNTPVPAISTPVPPTVSPDSVTPERDGVHVEVSCPSGDCSATLELVRSTTKRVVEKIRQGKKTITKSVMKTTDVVLGESFFLTAGKGSRAIDLKLNAIGRSEFARAEKSRKKLSLDVVETEGGTSVVTPIRIGLARGSTAKEKVTKKS